MVLVHGVLGTACSWQQIRCQRACAKQHRVIQDDLGRYIAVPRRGN